MTYNLTLVLRSSLKEAEKKKLLDSLKELFGKAKISEKEWGQKALAYPIKKEVSGVYVNWEINSDTVVGKDLEKKIYTNDGVLRHLFLRTK